MPDRAVAPEATMPARVLGKERQQLDAKIGGCVWPMKLKASARRDN